jgi:hypothetical protein
MPTPVVVDDEPQVFRSEDIQWKEYSTASLRAFITFTSTEEPAEWIYVDKSELEGQVRRIIITEPQGGETGSKPLVNANISTEGEGRKVWVYQVLDGAVVDVKAADTGR